MAALAKNPADRPDSAAGFGSALRASAEGSGALLRHAVSLYSEHFPVFFKLSLLASVPLIIFAAVVVVIDRDSGGENSSLAAILIFLAMIASNLFSYAAVAAGAVPLVVQLAAAPLRQIQVRTALQALKRRAGLFTAATLILLAMTLAGSLLLVVPGLALAFWHILYAPVTVMERLTLAGTLKRARDAAHARLAHRDGDRDSPVRFSPSGMDRVDRLDTSPFGSTTTGSPARSGCSSACRRNRCSSSC